VSTSLNNRLGALDRRLKELSASDFRLTDEELVSSLASYWDVEPPELGPEEVFGPEKSVRVATPIVQVELIMRVVAGDPAILQYWPDGTRAELAMPETDAPSGFDPLPPAWRIDSDELRFRAQFRQDAIRDSPDAVVELLEAEVARARAIVSGYPDCLARWADGVKQEVLEAIGRLRRDHESFETVRDSLLYFPVYKPPRLELEIQDAAPSDEPSDRVDFTLQLPPKVEIDEGEWTTFVNVVRRWGSSLSRHPGSCQQPVDEYVLRDLLLATLHAVYPVAEGEVMTQGSKSDIYVLADPHAPEIRPIIAELKIWKGKSRVGADLNQHLGQLTLVEQRGLLLYFVRAKSMAHVRKDALRAVSLHPGFDRWSNLDDIGQWPAARLRSPLDKRKSVVLNVGMIHVPKP
jgi:hypothetical protein